MTGPPRVLRAAVPVPPAVAAWPDAIQPGRAVATSAGLELVYRSARAGEVRVLIDERGGARTLTPGRDPSLAGRLTAQLAARGRTLPASTLTALRRQRRALQALEREGSLPGPLGVFRWLLSPEGPPPRPSTDDETVAALGVAALSRGDVAAALEALDRRPAPDPLTVGDVLLLAFAGRGVEARAGLKPPAAMSPMSAIAWENVAIALLDWEAAHRFSRAHTATDDPARLVVAMHLALEAGAFEWAGKAARRVLSLDASPEAQDAALRACMECGGAEAAAAWLRAREAPTEQEALRGAEIALYRRRFEEAAGWLARLPARAPTGAPDRTDRKGPVPIPDARVAWRATRLRGALALAEGRYDDAVATLAPVLEAWPKDRQTTILLGEAHLRAGRERRGMEVLERFDKKVTGEHPAAKLLLGLGSLAELYEAPELERAPGSTLYLYRNIALDVLGEKPSFGPGDIERERAFLWRALDGFGGNRSDTLTRLDGDELRSARHVQDPRVHVVAAQHAVLTETVEAARARLRGLGEARPDVPYPRTYEAELDLWRGDYRTAAEAFEAVYRETGTRWGYVGWGASLTMLGESERAIEVLDDGVRRLEGAIDGEATPAYRGEALLALGRVEEAIADLRTATRLRPRRLGAWATLALALHRAGDDEGAVQARDRFLDATPVLSWETQKLLGLTPTLPAPEDERWRVLARARERLGGNRSSYLLTFYDAEDRWRVHEIAGHLPRMREMAGRVREGVVASALEAFLARHHGAP